MSSPPPVVNQSRATKYQFSPAISKLAQTPLSALTPISSAPFTGKIPSAFRSIKKPVEQPIEKSGVDIIRAAPTKRKAHIAEQEHPDVQASKKTSDPENHGVGGSGIQVVAPASTGTPSTFLLPDAESRVINDLVTLFAHKNQQCTELSARKNNSTIS